jgi:hypothetical protein
MDSLKILVNIVGTELHLDELIKLNDQPGTQVIFHAWLDNDSNERHALDTVVNNRHFRHNLGRFAYERVKPNFGWPSNSGRYVSAYRENIQAENKILIANLPTPSNLLQEYYPC